MPVDWSNLATALSRTLRANQQESDQQTQLQQQNRQIGIQQQNEKLNERQQTLNEGLSAPTTEYMKYLNTLPPAERAEKLRELVIPGALKAQANQQAVDNERNAVLGAIGPLMMKIKPEDQGIAVSLIQQISGADNLTDLRTAVRDLNKLAEGADKPPPPIGNIAVPGGTIPYTRSSSGYSYGLPGAGGSAGVGAGPLAGIPGVSTLPGGATYIRKPSQQEQAQLDSYSNVESMLPDLEGAVLKDMESGGATPPTSLPGKLMGAGERFGEKGLYKLGIPVGRDAIIFNASNIYGQLFQALTKGGSKNPTMIAEVTKHYPKATDSDEMLMTKIRAWRDIIQRSRTNLEAPPGTPGATGAAPAGGGPASGGSTHSPSRPVALAPPRGTQVKRSSKGDTYYTDTDGKIVYYTPGAGWVKEGAR